MTQEEIIIFKKLTGELPLRDRKMASIEDSTTICSPVEPALALHLNSEQRRGESFSKLSGYIQIMESTRQNHARRTIVTNHKKIGRLVVFIKKVIRKMIKWYVEPICNQQTDFNSAVSPSIGNLTELASLSFQEIAELKEQVLSIVEQREQTIKELHKEIANLSVISQERSTLIRDLQDKVEILTFESQNHQQSLYSLQTDLSLIKNGLGEKNAALTDLQNKMSQLQQQGLLDPNENQLLKQSASQSGEDCIIQYILGELGKKLSECTYLDLGANHAKELSNTYELYRNGARGVLVEANPNLIGELKLFRGEDAILNRVVGTMDGKTVPFYILNGDGLSTSEFTEAEKAIALNPSLQIEKEITVETVSVNTILNNYFEKAPDYLNIDIEGSEMDILNSINFENYRPLIISVETIPYRPHLVIGEKRHDIVTLMQEKGYAEYAFTGINSIFVDKQQIK